MFLGLFSSEIIIKMYGLGREQYFKSTFNIFDLLVSIDRKEIVKDVLNLS